MFVLRNIKYFYIKTIRKIKNFLLSDKSREFLVFLFFVLVSTGFWLLQTLKNDYDAEFSVPLKLINIPDDVVVTSELPNELRITVKDKGTVLLNYMLGQSFFPIVLDFNDYKNKGSRVRIFSKELEKKVQEQLNASTKLLGIKPDTLDFIYAKGNEKRIPVRLQGTITVGSQYYITDTVFTPDSVIVYAPKSILDTIRTAYTQQLNLSGITDTIVRKILLANIKGAKFVPNSVSVKLPVDIITEKTLEIPIKGINFPEGKILRTFPSKVKVTFQVGLNRFKFIHPDNFSIEIPYEDLLNVTSDKYKLKLSSVPSGVTHVRIVPDQVDFLIEQMSGHDGY